MIIGVLGPEGSYSEKAAKTLVLKCGLVGSELRYFDDIEDAFTAAAEGKADIAVVPVENSIEGSVGVTLDLLLEKAAVIVGEVVVKIEHCLLSKGGPEKVKVILSHPQGLAQCRHFLKRHFPEAELRSTGSTSHAARLARDFEEMAAIAAPEAAERYGLNILVSNIQDRKENHTRFIVVQAEGPGERGLQGSGSGLRDSGSGLNYSGSCLKDSGSGLQVYGHGLQESGSPACGPSKTSLIVYLEKDRPGALYELLGVFAKRGINLTRIESRPSKKELGDYYFYIDFEGHTSDALIKDALEDIKGKADMLKVLGSYPAFKNPGLEA
ncbi:prephenate dehydratase [Methanosarcina sp. KYL-1]|uniref:prephenate dehydratase n=1 Tax=Methanosarcina sp. KYL-1 TaxID=2602068 RepID=UPI002101A183|nr:prephenate dehydratase [Methanosarcina sp. KYL-1]MCQ1536984.1 prephenate dehydratase [Methanosarcina sp. KYL-1]